MNIYIYIYKENASIYLMFTGDFFYIDDVTVYEGKLNEETYTVAADILDEVNLIVNEFSCLVRFKVKS